MYCLTINDVVGKYGCHKPLSTASILVFSVSHQIYTLKEKLIY